MSGAQVASVEQRDGSEGQSAQTSHPPPSEKRRKKNNVEKKKRLLNRCKVERISANTPQFDYKKYNEKHTHKKKQLIGAFYLATKRSRSQSVSRFLDPSPFPPSPLASGVCVRFDLSGSLDFIFFLW